MKRYLYKKPLGNPCYECSKPSNFGYILYENGDETPICQKCASCVKFNKKRRDCSRSVKFTSEAKQTILEAFSCVKNQEMPIVAGVCA